MWADSGLWYATAQSKGGFKGHPVNRASAQVYLKLSSEQAEQGKKKKKKKKKRNQRPKPKTKNQNTLNGIMSSSSSSPSSSSSAGGRGMWRKVLPHQSSRWGQFLPISPGLGPSMTVCRLGGCAGLEHVGCSGMSSALPIVSCHPGCTGSRGSPLASLGRATASVGLCWFSSRYRQTLLVVSS